MIMTIMELMIMKIMEELRSNELMIMTRQTRFLYLRNSMHKANATSKILEQNHGQRSM